MLPTLLLATVYSGVSPLSFPQVTVEEMDRLVTAGNYTDVRRDKIGFEVRGECVIRRSGAVPYAKLPSKFWNATLFNLPADHDLLEGDRVRFRAIIFNECYASVHVWVVSWELIETKRVVQAE